MPLSEANDETMTKNLSRSEETNHHVLIICFLFRILSCNVSHMFQGLTAIVMIEALFLIQDQLDGYLRLWR